MYSTWIALPKPRVAEKSVASFTDQREYIVEAIQKCRPSRNFHETNYIHDLHENTQDNSPSSNEDDEFQDCQEYHSDQDLEPPTEDLLDFINSQDHSDDQLDSLLVLYGIAPDISIMLLYTFYQPVFYATHDQHFPSESAE